MRTQMFISSVVLFSLLASASGATRSIHVMVALCDNDSQGIVPVPKALGDGDDPHNNLYWGAMYGTKSFLKRSDTWKLIKTIKRPGGDILERCIFRHISSEVFLVADAYRGARIKVATEHFLNAAVGNNAEVVQHDDLEIPIRGGAQMVVYVGHNGLMDFGVEPIRKGQDRSGRDAIVLACKSKPYFEFFLADSGCGLMLLTTGLMAPEAYTLEAALEGWVRGENAAQVRERAARAYHKYQKCGLKAARRLFFSR